MPAPDGIAETRLPDSKPVAETDVLIVGTGPGLLDTYDAERAPVAAQIVRRANEPGRDTGQLVAALGLGEGHSDEEMIAALEHQRAPTAETQMGRCYRSSAVVADEEPAPAEDAEFADRPSTAPGDGCRMRSSEMPA